MSLSSVHSCGAAAPQTAATATGSTVVNAPRPKASHEENGHDWRGHHQGRGQLREALGQAFQSLGIDLPQRVAQGQHHEGHHRRHHDDEHEYGHGQGHRSEGVRHRHPPAAPAPTEPATDATPPSAPPAAPITARTLRSDLQDFMHELFQAVRGAYQASTGSEAGNDVQPADATASVPAQPGARLAIGLSALVSQVGAGQAPAGLQGAFDQLMNDLKAFGGNAPVSGSTGSEAPAGEGATSPTLQQVLGALQQRLGYGSSANDVSALGNTIDLAA